MSWIAADSVISTVSRSATPALARSSAPSVDHQSGSVVEAGATLTLACSAGTADISLTSSSSTR